MVDMIASCAEKWRRRFGTSGCAIRRPRHGMPSRLATAARNSSKKEIGGCLAVDAPPIVDRVELAVGFRRRDGRRHQRFAARRSRISCAGRACPALTEFHAWEIALFSTARSPSSSSSPSSSTTRSSTVPSGSSVGSSRTSRPLRTRARNDDMGGGYHRLRGPPIAGGISKRVCSGWVRLTPILPLAHNRRSVPLRPYNALIAYVFPGPNPVRAGVGARTIQTHLRRWAAHSLTCSCPPDAAAAGFRAFQARSIN